MRRKREIGWKNKASRLNGQASDVKLVLKKAGHVKENDNRNDVLATEEARKVALAALESTERANIARALLTEARAEREQLILREAQRELIKWDEVQSVFVRVASAIRRATDDIPGIVEMLVQDEADKKKLKPLMEEVCRRLRQRIAALPIVKGPKGAKIKADAS